MVKSIVIGLVICWAIISLLGFYFGTSIVSTVSKDTNTIKEMLRYPTGKSMIKSFGNRVSLGLSCMIPLVNIVVFFGFSIGFICMKKDYEKFIEKIILVSKGEIK